MRGVLVFLAQTITASVPLVLAAMGGVISERSGVATLALEGYMLAGAFGAAVGALRFGNSLIAMLVAALVGAGMGALFALGTVRWRAHAIVVGVAVNLFAGAATRVALKVLYDSASNSPALLAEPSHTGTLAQVALREAVRSPTAWFAPVSVVATWWLFARTVPGLRIAAAGEHADACRAQGLSVGRIRAGAIIAGAVLAALGGAHLTLNQHEFVAYMSGGRGFLALAAVILGGWKPLRVALAAVAIGALTALEATLAGRVPVPSAVLQSLPFAATLIAVVGIVGRQHVPREIGESG